MDIAVAVFNSLENNEAIYSKSYKIKYYLTSDLFLWGEIFDKSTKKKKKEKEGMKIIIPALSLTVNKQQKHKGMVLLNDVTSV